MVFQNFRFCVDLPPYLKTKSWTNLFYYGFPFDSPVRHLTVWILSLPSPKSPLPRRRSPFIFIASITLALHCLSFLHICSTSRSHVVTKCEHFFEHFLFLTITKRRIILRSLDSNGGLFMLLFAQPKQQNLFSLLLRIIGLWLKLWDFFIIWHVWL